MKKFQSSLAWIILVCGGPTVLAQFDFGGGSCSGSGSFQQQITQGASVTVGDIQVGIQGLRVELSSSNDVDIQLQNGSTEIVAWPNGILNDSGMQSTTYSGMAITYSGYNGDGTGSGNEYITVDETKSVLTMKAYGYAAGFATVDYSWTGKVGCTEGVDPSGSGLFTQAISQNAVVNVGVLPAGIDDVYVRLESASDIDIQLYDGNTAIVDWQGGIISGEGFGRANYPAANVYVQYSGYNGEQRSGTLGQEYIYIEGTLSKPLTMKVLGYAAGTANVEYSWGYYHTATGSGNTLKSNLHNIIDGHTEISYSNAWDALRRTDQDPANSNNVIALYSRASIPKADQDSGCSCPDFWNREHVYAKSHGNFGTSRGAGTDIHALRASDKTVNTERSNKDFDQGGTQLSSSEPRDDCPTCLETTNTFEPPDAVKGDVARMLFYMATRYNGDSNSNNLVLALVDTTGTPSGSSTTGNGQLGKLSILKQWHTQDPVDDSERHRNNIVFDIQGNRNPFIDHPEWVNSIF